MDGGVFYVPKSLAAAANKDRKMQWAQQLVLDLSNPDVRENALRELSKMTKLFEDMANNIIVEFVWYHCCTFKEIVSIYPVLSTPNLTLVQSDRVCSALAILQCVASYSDTRMQFVNAQYLFPLLKTKTESRPFNNLKLNSLGVVVAVLKVDLARRILQVCWP